ncbi:PPM-type phosphatase domain-containing protein [Durusdinium trenchii]|uniref:PPM-type phosphatase domain-containing protein n=1 Tax=Durusdinium trenchii TaxID=1381693 RepID=A0ABP0PZM9_9DINO
MEDQQAVNFVRSRLPPPGSKKGLVPVLQELLDSCCANTPCQRGGRTSLVCS